MQDVARIAGVSITTVSHVVNQTRPVNDETADAVHRAIEETGFVPNSLARALVQSRTMTLGVAMPAISNRYFSELVDAIQREAIVHGYSVVLADTGDHVEQEIAAVRELRSRRVDGLIIAACAGPEEGGLSDSVRGTMPIVQIDRLADSRFDAVGVDNSITNELVVHLLAHGHRRIAVIAGPASVATVVERTASYRDCLLDAGLEFDPELVRTGATSVKVVRETLDELLELADPPTAFVAANNVITIGLLRALKEAGRDVPGDCALVGFDDFDWADLVSPSLTTVAHPRDEIGSSAVRLLIERLDDPDTAVRELRVGGQLRIRRSCGC